MYTTQGDYIEGFMIMPPPDYPTIDNILMVQPSDKECWWSIHREKSASEITANQKEHEYCHEPGLDIVEIVYRTPPAPFLPVKEQSLPYLPPPPTPGAEFDVKIEDTTYESLDKALAGNRDGFSIYPNNNILKSNETYNVNGMQMKIFSIYKNTYNDKDVVAYDVISNKARLIPYTMNKFAVTNCPSGDCVPAPPPPVPTPSPAPTPAPTTTDPASTTITINVTTIEYYPLGFMTTVDENTNKLTINTRWLVNSTFEIKIVKVETKYPDSPRYQITYETQSNMRIEPQSKYVFAPVSADAPVPAPSLTLAPNACLERSADGIWCIKCNSGYKTFNETCVTNDTEVNEWAPLDD